LGTTAEIIDPVKLSTLELLGMLLNNDNFFVRGRAAHELGNRKEKSVPDILIKVMKNDDNLDVTRASILSFEQITGYKETDVLIYDKLIEWWENNKEDVGKKLKDLDSGFERGNGLKP